MYQNSLSCEEWEALHEVARRRQDASGLRPFGVASHSGCVDALAARQRVIPQGGRYPNICVSSLEDLVRTAREGFAVSVVPAFNT